MSDHLLRLLYEVNYFRCIGAITLAATIAVAYAGTKPQGESKAAGNVMFVIALIALWMYA